ncbi:hypothetical protein GWK47_053527 [Chionoecetes opilio]|uniref:Uncharacterized protein n=1 Tax=Chionoecetes opilio TaxID=41210 RepID=A0A8J4Y7W0_CHIOP|nr:hypothetical protein GWK47_053527 [Chionoecetes opilio]
MWMSSTLAADAPSNDLQFMKDMMKFKRTDPEIAQAVLQKLEKPQVVPDTGGLCRSLSSVADSVTKRSRTLLPSCTPLRSQIASDEGNLCSLRLQPRRLWADLVGPESHLLLDTLGIEYDGFCSLWRHGQGVDDYSKALEYVSNVKVVNDIAERGVKMMTDFANIITTDSQQKQYLLQTVEYNRERFDSFKKQTLKR